MLILFMFLEQLPAELWNTFRNFRGQELRWLVDG
jgi:hypothetical protein